MKVGIVGAGAIGTWLGVKLGLAGCDVSVLARGESLNIIRRHGLTLKSGDQAWRIAVQVSDEASRLGPCDLVIVCVKAPALHDVSKSLQALTGQNTTILTAMNGVPWWFLQGFGGPLSGYSLQSIDPGGEIAAAISLRQVLGGVVHASCALESPGVARHHFGEGLILGEPAGGQSERLSRVVGLLIGAGFNATASMQIQRDIWYKLWGNMTINPVSALTGALTDKILDDELVLGFVSAVMQEAKEIGARLGISIDQEPQDRHAVTRKLGAFKTSMLQDVQAGKKLELDALVSSVRELGQLTGVATPMTDALLGLARLQARTLGLY